MSNFIIPVSYNQISLFDLELQNPFNDWSDRHIKQGFSWRPGSVSFGTLENTDTEVSIRLPERPYNSDDAVRAIVVPFIIPGHGKIGVASVGNEYHLTLKPGCYELRFELGGSEDKPWCHFSFVENDSPVAKILKADSEVDAQAEILMEATPAA